MSRESLLDDGELPRSKEQAETFRYASTLLRKLRFTLTTLITVSVICNALLLVAISVLLFYPRFYKQNPSIQTIPSSRIGEHMCRSTFMKRTDEALAQLVDDPAVVFPWSIGYGPEVTNHSLADERWEAIDVNDGTIVLDDDYVIQHNLAPSQRFPWDPSKGIYQISAFHTLHCLKNLHRLLYDFHHGRPPSRKIPHAMHCLDRLRKETLCYADDSILATPPIRHEDPGPRGQTRVCKNWDALVAWAKPRNACYGHVTDDDSFYMEHSEVDRYRFCPPDSPYRETMEKYFATH